MDRELTVWVGPAIIYLYGTVNGVVTTFTLVGDGNWKAIVPRTDDDNYVLHLEAYSSNGLEGTYNYTIYYGWMPTVTDRTIDDVTRVATLTAKGWQAMSEVERAEWSAGLKGAYNAADLNRVGHDVSYLTTVLTGYGYPVSINPKIDWVDSDVPVESEMSTYLANLVTLAAAFYGTVVLPSAMANLSYDGANRIELLLEEIKANIEHMIAGWHYCGATVCGGGIL